MGDSTRAGQQQGDPHPVASIRRMGLKLGDAGSRSGQESRPHGSQTHLAKTPMWLSEPRHRASPVVLNSLAKEPPLAEAKVGDRGGGFDSRRLHCCSVGAGFAADGRTVTTASTDGVVRAYVCDLCGGLDGLLGLANRRLAATGAKLTPAQLAQDISP